MVVNTNNTVSLTKENYYEDISYLSTSRFKGYISCPLSQYAIDLGLIQPSMTKQAFIVGNYIHSYFESQEAHKKFVEENHKQLISSCGPTRGQLKSPFKHAKVMIESLEREELFNHLYIGGKDDILEKEHIVTGSLHGVPFKGKIDSVNFSGGYFVDLKTMKSIQDEIYSPTLRKYTKQVIYDVIERKYHLQMYIYQQLLLQELGYELTPYIVAVSKEPVPDKEIILIDEPILEAGKQIFESHIHDIKAILEGNTIPTGCGHCDYCLSNKHLTGFITLDQLI